MPITIQAQPTYVTSDGSSHASWEAAQEAEFRYHVFQLIDADTLTAYDRVETTEVVNFIWRNRNKLAELAAIASHPEPERDDLGRTANRTSDYMVGYRAGRRSRIANDGQPRKPNRDGSPRKPRSDLGIARGSNKAHHEDEARDSYHRQMAQQANKEPQP